jgi:hypothetical protein
VKVEGFQRAEGAKNVYKQLYHVVYSIHFQIALPVTLNIAAQVGWTETFILGFSFVFFFLALS